VTSTSRSAVGDGLRQLTQLRHQPFAVRSIGHAYLDAARRRLDTALERGAVLSQDPADVVAQLRSEAAQKIVLIDFEQHVRAALKVEPERHRLRRNNPRGHPTGNGSLEGRALTGREHSPGDLHPHAVRDLDLDIGGVVLHLRDFTKDAARRDHRIAPANVAHHLLVLLHPTLLRPNDEKPHDDEDENEWDELENDVSTAPGGGSLRESGRNQAGLHE
jgi:hypothetical protein